MKILMNAEAFGFGPSAMIAKLFTTINQKITLEIDYTGSGHTLDLQKKLPYHAIFDICEEISFKTLVKNYDCFITALDFEKARWAKEMNIPVIIYDNLTWYWRNFPDIIHDCYYIAQNFYGVQERLKFESVKNYYLVSPFSDQLKTYSDIQTPLSGEVKALAKKNNKIILINFGGLENPIWSHDVTINYIQVLLSVIMPLFKKYYAPLGYEIKILASQFHQKSLSQYKIETLSRHEVEMLLPKVAFAFMTPGLGNIIDSAYHEIPVCFLPPANDSQGLQLDILCKKGLINIMHHLDWNKFFEKIDYTQPQKLVLQQIKQYIDILYVQIANDTLTSFIQEIVIRMQKLEKDFIKADFCSTLSHLKSDDYFNLSDKTTCLSSVSDLVISILLKLNNNIQEIQNTDKKIFINSSIKQYKVLYVDEISKKKTSIDVVNSST